MKDLNYSQFTKNLIRQNEKAIKIRQIRVVKELQEINELRKQNRELIGRN